MKVGESLPVLEKTFNAVDLFAYGAATWDWHRMHYDAELARSKVNGDVVVLQQRLLNGERVIAECTSSLSLR